MIKFEPNIYRNIFRRNYYKLRNRIFLTLELNQPVNGRKMWFKYDDDIAMSKMIYLTESMPNSSTEVMLVMVVTCVHS